MIVAKYKFDKSIYSNLIPVFNDGYTGYTVSDVTEGNIVTRTIECDTLPTVIRFGENTGQYEDSKIGAKAKSLKEVLYVDISSITYGNHMFGSCINLTQINTEGWNNNSLASINSMFFCCKSLVNLDVTSLVGDTVVDVGYAFYYCAELYNLTGLESWDTSNVTYMANIFQNCFKLPSIDVSSWKTSNVTNMGAMFANCYNLTSLDVSSWNTSNVTNMWGIFYYCNNLTSLDVSNFNTSKVTDMSHMFYYCTNLTSITFGSNFNTSNVKAMDYMFCNCNNLTSLDLSNFNTSNVTSMYQMFFNCQSLTSLDVSNFDTSKVTTMGGMFQDCRKLTSLDLNNFDTSNVTKMNNMFYDCTKLTSLDVSNFDTSKVTNMYAMFHQCANLTSIDVSNFDTSNVTNVHAMFYNCYKLTTLDVSNFDTSKVTTMTAFAGLLSNTTILNLNNLHATDEKTIIGDDDRFLSDTVAEKIYLNDLDTLNTVMRFLPDRIGKEAGKLVTSLRNKISEETLTTLTTKNWEIVDIVAQYRYDANTYEDLIPEFNTEFSSDKYEIYDSVSDIVIDDIKWEEGSLNQENGENHNRDDRMRVKNYISVIPNVTYKEIGADRFSNVCWYDKDKKFISYEDGLTLTRTSPNNAYFMRLFTTTERYSNVSISAKLITRSIESVNGDLPTLMRFGTSSWDIVTDESNSLLKIVDLNSNNLIRMTYMFNKCTRLTNVNTTNWDTSKVNNMYSMFYGCYKLTTLDVSNWNTSKVTNMGDLFSTCQSLTSLDVSKWVTSSVTNMYQMFGNCTKLTSLDVSNFDTANVTDMSYMFYGCGNLITLDVSNFNTSKVTNMKYMFYNCYKLTLLDLSNWVTSKVTDMREMFYECNVLSQINQTNLVTSALLSTNRMFYGCNKLTSLDVSNWNTSNVTDMSYMFQACYLLTELDVSNWDTSNVTDMSNMFFNCTKLASLDVSNWDTSKVTTMEKMFYTCNKLTSLDVSNWDTSNVTNLESMFSNCNKLTSLDVSNWDTSNVTKMNRLFYYCQSLTSLDVSNWDTSNVTAMYDMFISTSLTRLNIGNWNTNKTNSVAHMLYSCESLIVLDINNFDISNLSIYNIILQTSSLRYIRCNNIYTINILTPLLPSKTSLKQGTIISNAELSEETIATLKSKNWTVVSSDVLTKVAEYVYDSKIWNSMIPIFNDEFVEYFIDDIEDENGLVTRTISSMGGLPTLMRFGGDSNIKKAKSLLKILDINTSNVTNMHTMFFNCINLTSLDVSNWDTSNVTNMYGMFSRCNNLISLDVSKWDTSNVTNMKYIFDCCTSLTQLDISNWDISKIASTLQMFGYCYKLTTLDISNWDISNVTDMTSMFTDTFKLTDIGMLYCSPSTINKIATNLPTTHTQTIWVKDTDINKLTSVSGVEFKEYKENSYIINLSSPLLNGDKIEVVDGKLCHYHKMGMVVLDGSEDWKLFANQTVDKQMPDITLYILRNALDDKWHNKAAYCDNFKVIRNDFYANEESIKNGDATATVYICLNKTKSKKYNDDVKQWLQENPTTVVYGLAEPYYEDITPIQSDIVLETYLECNLDIYTKLPIKTNVSYITNVPSLSTLSMRATEMKESDNIIANLTNMLDNEINE